MTWYNYGMFFIVGLIHILMYYMLFSVVQSVFERSLHYSTPDHIAFSSICVCGGHCLKCCV